MANVKDGVDEAALSGLGERDLPGIHGNLHRPVRRRGADQLPAALDPDSRSGPGPYGDCAHHIGPGQFGHQRICGVTQQLSPGRELRQAALVDYADTLGQRGRVLKGMSNHEGGQPEFGENVGELIAYVPAGNFVQGPEGLIEQQHPGLPRQRTGEGNPLTLTPRELPRPGAGQVSDSQPFEQIRSVAPAGKAHVGGDGEVRKQPVILRQVAHPPVMRAHVNVFGGVEPDLPAERDPPGGGAL